MLGPADVKVFSRAEPFKPYCIRTVDGTTYEIHYPYMAMALRGALTVGIPDPETNGQTAESVVDLNWDQVAAVEPLAPAEVVA